MSSSTGIPANLLLARFRTIDVQKLREDDPQEKKKLLLAAGHEGFFYLDYSTLPEVGELERVIEGIYNLEHELFDLPEDEKLRYDVDEQGPFKLNGWVIDTYTNHTY